MSPVPEQELQQALDESWDQIAATRGLLKDDYEAGIENLLNSLIDKYGPQITWRIFSIERLTGRREDLPPTHVSEMANCPDNWVNTYLGSNLVNEILGKSR